MDIYFKLRNSKVVLYAKGKIVINHLGAPFEVSDLASFDGLSDDILYHAEDNTSMKFVENYISKKNNSGF